MAHYKSDQADSITVPSKTLEKVLGVNSSRIRQLTSEGLLTKSTHGRYNLIDSMTRYVAHLKTNNEIKNSDDKKKEIDYETEKAKHEKAKREKTEIELDLMKNNVHEAKVVEDVMKGFVYNLRAKILAIPSTMAPKVAAENDVAIISDLLKESCHQALIEVADYKPGNFKSEKYTEVIKSE